MLDGLEPSINGYGGISSMTRELKETLANSVLTSRYSPEGLLGKWEYFTSIEDTGQGDTCPEVEKEPRPTGAKPSKLQSTCHVHLGFTDSGSIKVLEGSSGRRVEENTKIFVN